MTLTLANPGVAWLVIAVVYLALQPAWDGFTTWAKTWRGWPGRVVAGMRRKRRAGWLRALGQVLYCLGIPYAALLAGVADARRLGLAGLPWWPQFPAGALVGLIGVAFLAWSWGRMAQVSYRRGPRRQLLADEVQAFSTPWAWAPLLLEVLCLQVSWAFVRGAAIWLLGLYPGVFVGLALVAVTGLLRLETPAHLADPELRARGLLTAGLAVLSALVFLYSENLWLAMAVHGLGLFGAALAAGRAYAREGA